jgi:hypothetical protein
MRVTVGLFSFAGLYCYWILKAQFRSDRLIDILNDSDPVNLFRLVTNLQNSFQSVENLFHLSYLFLDQFSKCDKYLAPCPFHFSFEGRSPRVCVSSPSEILKLICAAIVSYQNQPTLYPHVSVCDHKCMHSLAHSSYRLSSIRAANFGTLTKINTSRDPTWWVWTLSTEDCSSYELIFCRRRIIVYDTQDPIPQCEYHIRLEGEIEIWINDRPKYQILIRL